MAEEIEKCNLNNILFLEMSDIKKELKDDSYIDAFENSISANDTELKDNVFNDRIRQGKIAGTMDDSKIQECNFNNIILLENSNKEEFKDDSYIDIFETCINTNKTELKDVWDDRIKQCKIISTVVDNKIELSSEASNIVMNENVKIEKEIDSDDIKIEFDHELLFCNHCNVHYQNYCTRCGMLAHILNEITLSITDGRAIKGIPKDILEVRESFGHVGVFALKVIPEGVKFGPFNGLITSESPWRLKGGKLMVPEEKPNVLNWMQYINPARNIFQQKLIPFQSEDNLYYHSNREILVGEELLVYFGEQYEDSVNKDFEVDFIAPTEHDVKDVFACTPCCLGFSSRVYLAKHKSTCPNETNGTFSIDELTQCRFCNIYFYEKEYLECHMPYCCERNVRRCIPLTLDNQIVKVNRRKSHIKTKHIKKFTYECEICDYKTNQKPRLEAHVKSKHLKQFSYQCEICDYKTNCMSALEKHVKSIHLKQFSYDCDICDYKTNYTQHFKRHVKSQHLKQFSYECDICDYKTNCKPALEKHVKSKHLKQFSYECDICDYQTNHKANLEIHVKSIHIKQLSYECDICDYKTSRKQCLKVHVKSKHLKQFSYECDICNYKTNSKSDLEKHVNSKHLKQFSYKCEICNYKANRKTHLQAHIKSKHLKQFSYECDICHIKTTYKLDLERHIKSKHLKQFSYKCDICDYKTNYKPVLEKHVKSKHLKQLSYKCDICDFMTNYKPNLGAHVKSIHLKQFSYECDICDVKTNSKSHLEKHVKSKHLKQFSYECEICDYKTNCKSYLKAHVKSKHLKQL